MTKRRYRVKVVEKHSDYVWVDAESAEEAEYEAIEYAVCQFECVYSSEVVSEEDIDND